MRTNDFVDQLLLVFGDKVNFIHSFIQQICIKNLALNKVEGSGHGNVSKILIATYQKVYSAVETH